MFLILKQIGSRKGARIAKEKPVKEIGKHLVSLTPPWRLCTLKGINVLARVIPGVSFGILI
jgi:hypothetical protein